MNFALRQYLFKEYSWWGQWWLPDRPDDKKSGPLTYSPDDRGQLQIGPGFSRERTIFSEENSGITVKDDGDWQVIHGSILNRPVSLFDCRMKRETSNSFSFTEGPDEQILTVQDIVVGKWILSPDEVAFSTLSASFESLTPWLGMFPVQSEKHSDPKEKADKGTILRVFPPQTRSCATDIGTITFSSGASEPFPQRIKGGFRYTSELSSGIKFDFNHARNLKDIKSIVRSFQELLALASNSQPGALELRAFDEQPMSTGFPLFFQTRGAADPDEPADSASTFLFSASDVSLETAVPEWLHLRQKISSVFNVLFGFRYSSSHFLESQVTALVSAAEALSKKFEIVDKSHSFIPNRNNQNKTFLIDRLWGLVMTLPEDLRKIVTSNPALFVREAKDARNGLSHSGEAETSPDILYGVARVTELILVCWTILKLGVDPKKLIESLHHNKRASHSIQVAKQAFPLNKND